MERHWPVDGAWNIRDLGGYPVAGGQETRWRRFLRSDGLHRLSPQTVDDLVHKGVRTIIDLRGAHETDMNVNPFRDCADVDYRNIPLFDGLSPIDLLSETAMSGYRLADRYVQALATCGDSFASVFSAMADARDGIVLFHCTAGKDRTGLVAALTLGLAGVAQEHVVDDYLLTATIGAPLLTRLHANALRRGAALASVEAILAVEPEAMSAALRHVTSAGGSREYLRWAGLDDAVLDRVRDRLLFDLPGETPPSGSR